MNAARIELEPVTPWGLRLFDRVPLPAFWTGLALGLGVFVLFLCYTAAFGAGFGHLGAVVFELAWLAECIQDLFLGFTIAIVAASVRGALRDFEALRPALTGSEERIAELRREILRYRRPTLLLAGLAVGAFATLSTVLDPAMWAARRFPGWTHPAVVWLMLRNFVNWWWVSRAALLELVLGRAFSRLGHELASVDLLDHAALAPFNRRALRNVSLWMLLAAFFSLTYLGKGWAGELMPLALLFLAAFAVAAFLTPLLGVHQRLRTAKRAEQGRVRAAIRAAREATLARPAAEPAGGRLADLLAYEARIAHTGAWPIETSTLLRFALILALGLGSWVGAALVEYGIGTLLR